MSKADTDIPKDFWDALLYVGPLLETAARVTNSHSATFRYLVPVVNHRKGERFQLKRVVAWPRQRLEDPYSSMPLRDSHANPYVARTGQTVHIHDTLDAASYAPYPGLAKAFTIPGRHTRSELCVPVVVDQRLIGTLNFESPFPRAYQSHEAVVLACSTQIAVVVSGIRRDYMNDVISIGSNLQASAHELAKLIRKLRTQEPSDILSEVNAVLSDVIVAMEEDREPQIVENSIERLLRDAASAAELPIRLFGVKDEAPVWSNQQWRHLYLALFDVFRNIRAFALLNESGYPQITVGRQAVGGKEYWMINIEHAYLPARTPDTRTMYRVPLQKHDGMHFGAYAAGAMVREIGGEIYSLRRLRELNIDIIICAPVGGKHDN